MKLTRRETLILAMGAAFAAMIPARAFGATVEENIAAFTGGADVGEGELTLIAPEIAENGNTVPIEVSAPGAVAIMVLATKNPNPAVATFKFGPLAAVQRAATRIRLAGTQSVLAIAKMPDGSFVQASQEVKVTIGGCGG